jgi:phosphomevalonate kinase
MQRTVDTMQFENFFNSLDSDEFTLSVPANLLLIGEYIITQDQGMGIWISPECRAYAHFSKSCANEQTLELQLNWENQIVKHIIPITIFEHTTVPQIRAPSVLASCCFCLYEAFKQAGQTWRLETGILCIDTNNFFYSDGRKKGFGSSAASTVLLVASLIALAGRNLSLITRKKIAKNIFTIALAAHRHYQSGKGSGYDVAACLYGGCGVFIGGVTPICQRIHQAPQFSFSLVTGNDARSTGDSINLFQIWLTNNKEIFSIYRARCKELVQNWYSECSKVIPDLGILRSILCMARDLGIALGAEIGVAAQMNAGIKALGAGNEIGLCIDSFEIKNNLATVSDFFPQNEEPNFTSIEGLRYELKHI